MPTKGDRLETDRARPRKRHRGLVVLTVPQTEDWPAFTPNSVERIDWNWIDVTQAIPARLLMPLFGLFDSTRRRSL